MFKSYSSGLNTLEVWHLCKDVAKVCAINEVDWNRRNVLYVINTTPLPFKIGHWIAVYIPKNGVVEVLDPLGDIRVANIIPFTNVVINRKCLQNVNLYNCGYYAAFFVRVRNKYSYNYIVNTLQKYGDRDVIKYLLHV